MKIDKIKLLQKDLSDALWRNTALRAMFDQVSTTCELALIERDALQAKVARLNIRSNLDIDSCCNGQKIQLRTRIAELEAGLRRIGCIDDLCCPSDPCGICQLIGRDDR